MLDSAWSGARRFIGEERGATFVCLFAALLYVLPLSWGGAWPGQHEGIRYPLLVEHFYQVFSEGKLWPRWLPDLQGGYGYPQFVYYQPLFFWLAVPFRALLGDPVSACWAVIALSLFVGARGAFSLCDGQKEPVLGFLGAALFLLAPYLSVNWLVRGDLTELLAMALLPWALFFFLRALDGRSGSPLGVVLALTIVAHPIIGILAGIFLALGAVIALLQRTPVSHLLRVAWGGGAALLLSSPYWLPLGLLREASHINDAFTWLPTDHVVPLWQMLSGEWGTGGSKPLGEEDGMVFPLGRLSLGLALLGGALSYRERRIQMLAFLLVFGIFCITPSSTLLWTLPPFSLMQFPWRLLALTAILQIGLLRGFSPLVDRFPWWKSAAVGALLLATLGWRQGQFSPSPAPAGAGEFVKQEYLAAKTKWRANDDLNELLPSTVYARTVNPHGAGSSFFAPGAQVEDLSFGSTSDLHAEIRVSRPTVLVIKQYYFPGWSVSVDGAELSPTTLEDQLKRDGLIRVSLLPRDDGGPTTIRATYDQPLGARFGWGLALLTLVLMLLPRFGLLRSVLPIGDVEPQPQPPS